MPLDPHRRSPVMCLTLDGLPSTHVEQAEHLCAAGARWVQLRTKQAAPAEWLATARAVMAVCRRHGAIGIINDNLEIAVAAGADGVHLGQQDLDWTEARRRLGPHRIIGGTVNNAADANRACRAGCLDYVGVGPLRFTSTKKNLAPALGLAGVGALIAALPELPAWVIGGVESADLPALRQLGAAGAAVSSALFREGRPAENFRSFHHAWETSVPSLS